jgi:hypothetical protein
MRTTLETVAMRGDVRPCDAAQRHANGSRFLAGMQKKTPKKGVNIHPHA